MDLYRTIQDLYEEKEKLERVISSLEELQRTAALAGAPLPPANRRGRKSMAPEERREVSERMKRYWDARRKRKDSPERQPE
jgi:DNA invertase Pin-like site-specific DNA recombinase